MRSVGLATVVTVVAMNAAPAKDVAIAPPPREIRADGSRDPVPPSSQAKQEDPREVIERIIKNSQTVSDKLANSDPGVATQQTQAKILRDIDALLNRQQEPMNNSSMTPEMNSQQPEAGTDKKDNMMPMGGKDPKESSSQPQDKGNMNMGGGMGQQLMNSDQPRGHRPRQHVASTQPKDTQQKPTSKNAPPMSGQISQQPPKTTGSPRPDSQGEPKVVGRTTVPFQEDLIKDVWGHLPDKLRQQASEYYKQELMPRYAELLRLYYSSLTEKEKK